AEHDDLEMGFGSHRSNPFDEANGGHDPFLDDNPRAFDDVLDDFTSESANDDFLDGDFDEDDFVNERFDSEDIANGYLDEDDEFEYQSTPPGAFMRACERELQRKPHADSNLDQQSSMVQDQTNANYVGRDRGPSYAL
ncbi:MAG: hypothetical protein AB8B93_20780, partial [Pseudomonadales bacterium]